ncbi:MAG: GDP-mannose 4,6-dehydratase [Chloroflexi bacterium]|nr:GDP-mannose 4,6-dehydratase [Chloroflexota bacterium]
MSNSVYFVTGSMGFIGAWTLYHLVKQGKTAVSYDLSERRDRVNLLLTPEEQAAIRFVTGDLTNTEHVIQMLTEHKVTHIIHLGALQVPLVRANPIVGAQVNVVGTANLLDGAKRLGIPHIVYASSIAVYGAVDKYPPGLIQPDAPLDPHTLYGVYKQANELAARVYWEEYKLTSTALRPYTVYGVGRDQGLTSEPTKAMLAVAAGQAVPPDLWRRVPVPTGVGCGAAVHRRGGKAAWRRLCVQSRRRADAYARNCGLDQAGPPSRRGDV